MDKVTIEVAIERDLLEEAQRLGVDVQLEAERGLRRRLGDIRSITPEERAKVDEQIERYNDYVERHGLFADQWRPF